MKYSAAHRYRLASTLGYLVSHSLLFPLSKFKLVSEEEMITRWGGDLAFVVAGLTKQEVSQFFRRLVEEHVLNRLRPDIIKILRHHQSQGCIVVLLSGVFRELLEVVGWGLGVFHVVGTKLEMLDGQYTGGITGPVCFGMNKVNLFNEFINSVRLEIDLTNSFAYADSIADTAMLEMVGNPVAVYPDRKLRRLALQRGWQLIGK